MSLHSFLEFHSIVFHIYFFFPCEIDFCTSFEVLAKLLQLYPTLRPHGLSFEVGANFFFFLSGRPVGPAPFIEKFTPYSQIC